MTDLAPEDRVLRDVRDQLYGGDWDELERDLRARLEGKPFIFKLASKIEEDLARIARLRQAEREGEGQAEAGGQPEVSS